MHERIESLLRAYLRRTLGSDEDTWTILPSGITDGRGVYATRDFQPGDTVFHDRPVVSGPRAKVTLPTCSSCHHDGRVSSCPAGCYLPVCSPECSTSDTHVRECRLVREKMSLPAKTWRLDLVGTVAPLRCLSLSEEDREVVRCLQANHGNIHGREVDLLKSLMKENLNKEDEMWMRRCCEAMDTNAYELLRLFDDGTTASLRGVYPLAAMLNHDCCPNTSHHYDHNGVMKVFATKPIAEMEELTTSYGALMWATTFRRIHLNQSKDFLCRCVRCSDPTEFGTMLSGLPCTRDGCRGVMLQADPLNQKSKWHCDSCTVRVAPKRAALMQVALGAEMDRLADAKPLELARYLALTPVPSSQVAVQLKTNIIWQLGHRQGLSLPELSQEVLDFKESCCRDILHLLEQLKLGLCRARGLMLIELHGTLCEQLRRQRKSERPTRQGLEAEIRDTLVAATIIAGDDDSSRIKFKERVKDQNELIPQL